MKINLRELRDSTVPAGNNEILRVDSFQVHGANNLLKINLVQGDGSPITCNEPNRAVLQAMVLNLPLKVRAVQDHGQFFVTKGEEIVKTALWVVTQSEDNLSHEGGLRRKIEDSIGIHLEIVHSRTLDSFMRIVDAITS